MIILRGRARCVVRHPSDRVAELVPSCKLSTHSCIGLCIVPTLGSTTTWGSCANPFRFRSFPLPSRLRFLSTIQYLQPPNHMSDVSTLPSHAIATIRPSTCRNVLPVLLPYLRATQHIAAAQAATSYLEDIHSFGRSSKQAN